MMETAKLPKMKKNLEIPKTMKDIASSNPVNVLPVEEIIDMTHTVGVVIREPLVDKGECVYGGIL